MISWTSNLYSNVVGYSITRTMMVKSVSISCSLLWPEKTNSSADTGKGNFKTVFILEGRETSSTYVILFRHESNLGGYLEGNTVLVACE